MANPIGWCDCTWNPITGCSPVSPACDHCYARAMSKRLAGRYGYPLDDPFRVTFHQEKVWELTNWVKPRRIFVCSMGDLFHEDVKREWLVEIFRKMLQANWHTYLLLTKRPFRMQKFLLGFREWKHPMADHIWLGVTAENREMADERIPILLATPAAHRFVSCEPLLGPQYLEQYFWSGDFINNLDWVIAGAETGPKARSAELDWFRSIRDQCERKEIPFYLKDHPGTLDGKEHKELGDDSAGGPIPAARKWLEGK